MRLYILRHGDAAPSSPRRPDRERHLTQSGIEKMEKQAAAIRRAGWPVEYIVSSPYKRARQTAEIIGDVLDNEVETDTLLESGCSPRDVAELMRRFEGPRHVLLVGHRPDLDRFIGYLAGCTVSLSTGELALVETERVRPEHGTLVGLYDPEALAQWGACQG